MAHQLMQASEHPPAEPRPITSRPAWTPALVCNRSISSRAARSTAALPAASMGRIT
jgi:hypothetical protein